MNKFLFSYANTLVLQLVKLIRNRKQRVSPKRIHDFRLTVKRLRALIRLLNQLTNEQVNPKLNKSLRKIYTSTGKLRDLHIHTILLKSIKENSPYEVKRLSKSINKFEKKAKKKIDKSFKKLDSNSYNSLISFFKEQENKNLEISKEICYQFVENKHFKIRLLVGSSYEDIVLHEIRKHLKDIVYTLQLIQNEDSNFVISAKNLNWLNNLQERLGLWNDWFTLHQMIINANTTKQLYPQLEHIVGIEMEKSRLGIVNCLSKFCDLSLQNRNSNENK
jgi:CHAD domain-containing protein